MECSFFLQGRGLESVDCIFAGYIGYNVADAINVFLNYTADVDALWDT